VSFWSGETLVKELGSIVDPFDQNSIDCSAYTLAIGDEIFVSPDESASRPLTETIKKLPAGGAFTIPPGQFAFLLTRETVKIPANVLGFISMKTALKWKGLVNVSGFHVDPGFHGRLMFAVLNAGPATVHLKQGMPAFLIWFADLDGTSEGKFVKSDPVQEAINPDKLVGISGPVLSLVGLAKRIEDQEKRLSDRIHQAEKLGEKKTTLFTLLLTVAVGVFLLLLRGCQDSSAKPPPAVQEKPVPATPTPDQPPAKDK
jgi:dCTP deaminase